MENAQALDFYRQLLRIRRIEEQIALRYSEQEMRCPVHLSIGQEAVAVGVCGLLKAADKSISAHRSHAHYLAKGGSLKAMLAEIYGKATGCAGGRGGSMHLIDLDVGHIAAVPIVGSAIPIGAGVAWAQKLRGGNDVAAIFFGDGATEEGAFYETLNFASLHKLPVLFICENNLYSVYSPLEVRQANERSVTAIAESHGIKTFTGDGNDLFEVASATEQALALVRKGDGPALLEFDTFRWLEHCGPDCDDHLNYRPDGELAAWKERCPLARITTRLQDQGTLDKETIANIESEIALEIEDAFTFAQESAFPSADSLDNFVYAS